MAINELIVDDSPSLRRLGSSGEGGGRYVLEVLPGTAGVIAENFRGQLIEEISDSEVEQVLCELPNMIWGSFSRRPRGGFIFDLKHPESEADATQVPATVSKDTIIEMLNLDRQLYLWMELAA